MTADGRWLPTFTRHETDLSVALSEGSDELISEKSTGEVVRWGIDHAGGGLRRARVEGLVDGTWIVRERRAGSEVRSETITIGDHPGERPVHAFITSYEDEHVDAVSDWQHRLRATVVQFYDWMAGYTEPLGPSSGWKDPSARPVSLSALRALAADLELDHAVAHAYAPVYAVGHEYARRHPEQLLYDGDGVPIPFLDQIILADPGHEAWQRHFAEAYGHAADVIGFGGFHVDTYGYPRVAYDAAGRPLDMRARYESFLRALRASRPNALLSFNQVNGVPGAVSLPGGAGFRYCEVWPPNVEWRHLEGLLDRSAGTYGRSESARREVRGTIACYPPVWGGRDDDEPISERGGALRTCVLTEAVATCWGAAALLYGDRQAVLRDPYYPQNERLLDDEGAVALRWRRFALACRDLFIEGEDTTWIDIGDENGAINVVADAPVAPEPCGGCVFVRVTRTEDRVAVAVVDLTGSECGRWSERTAAGRVQSVKVQAFLGRNATWSADAAVLGAPDARFRPWAATEVPHRWGRALEIDLPLVGGWSVVRFRRV